MTISGIPPRYSHYFPDWTGRIGQVGRVGPLKRDKEKKDLSQATLGHPNLQ